MLKQDIQNATTEALKNKDSFTVDVLRMILAAISAKEKDKRYKLAQQKPEMSEEQLQKESAFSDQEVIDTLSSEVKKRRDAIALYEQGKRPELAEKEKKEIELIQKYLPAQLSLEELRKLVEESIAKVGAKEIKDTGKIMQDLMPKVKGRAEGSEISKIIKELLSK